MRTLVSGVFALMLLCAQPAAAGSATPKPQRIACLGDSLTAGFGLRSEEAFPAVLERALRQRGHQAECLNFGVSGDTTAGGVSRTAAVIAAKPTHVILELGANDGLRGIDPAVARENLDRIIVTLKQAGIPVLLAGMKTLPGMGRRYGEEFAAIFPGLAEKHGLMLYPFFLDGVAGNPALNLPDGLHPTAQGIEEITRRLLPQVEAFLKDTAK